MKTYYVHNMITKIDERFILQKYDHPFIVKLYFVYQEPFFINMIMEFVQGGELFYHLNKRKKFD